MLTDNPDFPLVLLLEGNENHVELIQRYIDKAQEGYRLEIAGSLQDAWRIIDRNMPDIVLTDYILPDGDGNELVVMVNEQCPVIIMTSFGNETVAVSAMKIGAHDYIVKSPEAFENLPHTLKYALISWSLIAARRQIAENALRAKNDWKRTFDSVPELIAIITSRRLRLSGSN